MDLERVHFIREVLVNDFRGNPIPAMQISYDNAAWAHPNFTLVSFEDENEVRELYRSLGGSRIEGEWMGTTVVIPNRPRRA